jgi:quercetin dioxygenase-like cupin family protein
MSAFAHISTLDVLPIWDGVTARTVDGREMTLAYIELAPHAVVAEHQHPNEQMGIVLAGMLRFTVGGETKELRAGDTYSIPGGVPHDVVAGPDGGVALDIFAPVRADWRRFAPSAAVATWWPSPSGPSID